MAAVQPGTGLTNDQVERLITQEYTQSQDYMYGNDMIAAERDRNYDYYRGIMNDLPAPPGRSRVVSFDVANYIGMMLPNLLRVFTAGRTLAQFVSPRPELEDATELATRYINDVVFRKDNRGELLLSDWGKDGLIQKVGFAMWIWEDSREAADEIVEGLTDGGLAMLIQAAQAEGAEIVEYDSTAIEVAGPDGAMVEQRTHSVKVRRWKNTSKCCIYNIPPEEFAVSKDARHMDDAVMKGHRTGVLVGDLLAQGFDPEIINALPAYIDPYPDRMRKYNDQQIITDPSRVGSEDPMLRRVGIFRGILKCDYDGTGTKDWYVVAGGSTNRMKLLDIQPYNWQIGFADFCPEPMPHTIWGTCPADRLSMIQKVNTVLTRSMLDGLYLHLNPQREVVMDNIIKPDQLNNSNPGASVLVRAAGTVNPMVIPYVGDKALITLQHFEGQAEVMSGVGRASTGLDPGALANQSATAANNQYNAMLGRTEMIARTWAQGGMRKLFRGVFNCVRAYQDFARVEVIDGAPVKVDPQEWAELDDLDVNINTGLGTGSRERDAASLSLIYAAQKELLEKLGPNPIVDFDKLSRTLQLSAESLGLAYPKMFFGDGVMPDGQPWAPQPAEPQPSPDTIVNANALVEIEKIKAESSEREKAAELDTKYAIDTRGQDIDAILEANKLGIDTAKVFVGAAKVDMSRERPEREDDED